MKTKASENIVPRRFFVVKERNQAKHMGICNYQSEHEVDVWWFRKAKVPVGYYPGHLYSFKC